MFKLLSVILGVLLLATMAPTPEARRGGGFRGGGGGGRPVYRAPPPRSSGPSTGKIAGAAAVGAIGGTMLGSALSRPGYGYGGGYGGYGGYGGFGGGYGYPRVAAGHAYKPAYEAEGSGDLEYYTGASSGRIYSSIIVLIGTLLSLLLGHWSALPAM
ncbi:shadow of prion protein 2 [Nerophis lumbriciformis]|uniref:shadow of prion protein 2 n=1 Tax=Nerophis lumbriciformis TaxID=546530 RepID=UPI002AE05417|nr:keratin-associated protein 19-2-like [Nerophis lumbriciformis]XP_061784308.1 keratin-associated protein 19-2-like [Nerophis lumbriciformis]XP_061784309.1 keratin-associated protein 19-2-like [Nerophis lumbriciformis]